MNIYKKNVFINIIEIIEIMFRKKKKLNYNTCRTVFSDLFQLFFTSLYIYTLYHVILYLHSV